MYFNLSLQISIFFLFLLPGGGSFGLTDPKVSINQMLSHGTYMLHNGSIIPMDNENKVTYTEAIIVKDKRITSTMCGVTSIESIEKNLKWAKANISTEFWDEILKLPFSSVDPEAERVFTPG